MTVATAPVSQASPSPQKHRKQHISVSDSSPAPPNIPYQLMETLQSLRQQVQGQTHDIQQRAQGQFAQIREWLYNNCSHCANTVKEYSNRYPPLAAVVLTLVALSAVPVGAYVIFAAVSSAIVLTVALIGFSIVEGTMLMATGGVLLVVLSGIGLFTLCTFGFAAFVYVAYRVSAYVISQIVQTTGNITGGGPSGGFNLPSVSSPQGMTPMQR